MKMDKPHILHLNQNLCKFLENYKSIVYIKSSSKYLFSSIRTSLMPISDNSVRAMLRNIGYTKEQITPHGFRAMFSTLANERRDEHGQSPDIIELCLAHTERNKARDAYNHAKNLKQRQILMQWWSQLLTQL